MMSGARDLSRTTRFDMDVLLPADGNEDMLAVSNSRQIARGPDGTWLALLRRGKKDLILKAARCDRPRGEDFTEEILVVGDFQPAVFETTGRLRGMAGIAFDRRGTLHLFWCEGRKVQQAMIEASDLSSLTPLKRFKSWSRRTLVCPGKQPLLADAIMDPKGWARVVCTAQDGVFVGQPRQAGEFHRVCETGRNARLALDSTGAIHLTYDEDREVASGSVERVVCYLRSADGETWTGADGSSGDPDVAAHAISWRPALVCWRDRPLVVFQTDGVRQMSSRAAHYLRDREGSGAGVGFAWHDGGAWRRGWVAKAEEILVRRISPVAPEGAEAGQLTPRVEVKSRPSLVTDAQGVPWAWWIDTTRRMTYWARWLGERFSDPAEHGGPYYRPTEFLTAQDGAGDRAGLVLLADGQAIFDSAAGASLRAADDDAVCLTDLMEIAELSGLEHDLQPMAKFDGNPVFSADASAGDGPRVHRPIVVYDDERERYVMRYLTDSDGWRWAHAESDDGVAWERPAPGEDASDHAAFILPFRDASEPRSSRRYKGILYDADGRTPRQLVTSSDGLDWKPDERIPAERLDLPFTEPWGIGYLDAAPVGDGEYKVIGRTWHDSGRALGMMGCVDLFRWHHSEVILDPDAPDKKPPSPQRYAVGVMESNAGPRDEDQIQYGFSFGPAGRTYLLFYAPRAFDGRYGLSLATSRDGRHFARCQGGRPVVACGAAGEWDSGFIAASSFGGWPCRRGDEFRIYYAASGWHGGDETFKSPFRIGFASQLRDRWSYVRLERDADVGWLTTIPIDMTDATGRALFLNVEGLERVSGFERGGRVAAEFLDAETWQPIEGYTCADCLPIEEDGLGVRVHWKDKRALPRGRACGVRLRIVIDGWTPKLFAFRFGGVKGDS